MLKIVLGDATYNAKISGRVSMDVADFQDSFAELTEQVQKGTYTGGANRELVERSSDLLVAVFGNQFGLDELLDNYDADKNGGKALVPFVTDLCSLVTGVATPKDAPASQPARNR